jgi:hypothetical protein
MKPLLPAAALLLVSTAACAQLAPQDIIENWRGYYQSLGMGFSTGTPEVNGDTTRYSDITTRLEMVGGEVQTKIDWAEMRRNDDGSVDITFSPAGSTTSTAETPKGTVTSTASFDIGGFALHAEGTPDDIHFSYTAPVVTLQQTQNLPGTEVSMTMVMQDLQGDMRSRIGSDGAFSQTVHMTSGALSFKGSGTDTGKAPTYFSYETDSLTLDYDMDMPAGFAPDPAQPMMSIFAEGAVIGMSATTGPATLTVDKKTAGGSSRFSITQSGGELTFAYAENALSYGLSATAARFGIANTPAQPLDASVAFERLHFGITLPVHKADIPAPFALSVALEGFTMEDSLWALFDPQATLSRAPASLSFSVSGTARLFVDLFDQTALTALRGAPFELRALSLSGLNLSVEGLGLTGNGDVTFDNTRMDPASGLPEPTGALDFSITGALGLLDKLGRLGIGDPMMIIGAKGALGMFATAGDAPDSFTSHLEFSQGGHIFINGQQVK